MKNCTKYVSAIKIRDVAGTPNAFPGFVNKKQDDFKDSNATGMSSQFTIIYDLEYTAQINRTDRNLDHAKTPVIISILAQFSDKTFLKYLFFIHSFTG